METRAATAVSMDTEPGPQLRPHAPPTAAPVKAEAIPTPADLRLVIEENAATGVFIYKTIDRRTGEVVSQLPREEVVRLHQSEDYFSGDVIRTRA